MIICLLLFFSEFRSDFLSALAGLGNSTSRGMFINSCYAHCQTEMQETWLRNDSPLLGNKVTNYIIIRTRHFHLISPYCYSIYHYGVFIRTWLLTQKCRTKVFTGVFFSSLAPVWGSSISATRTTLVLVYHRINRTHTAHACTPLYFRLSRPL